MVTTYVPPPQVSMSPILVVIFHDDTDLPSRKEELREIHKQVNDALKSHRDTLTRHLELEHPRNTPKDK